uniref:MudrA protein-maize transposon MuDR n=1 Tax=Oryza sativa subsp. japonica TaxID=39947 RepID=Q9AYG0_ORYSJ|nr:mudrA protein - maize transposon MuDR [Oryza sativa Japonica Group]
MATQGWIADIIGDWVKKNPQKKAKDAKEKPFIGVDATKLTGKYTGQLASATVVDERLVISADACKGLEKVVDASFPMPVEHRECIRHLYSNFLKKFHGTVITDHLYHVTKSYTKEGFKYHMGQIHVAKPEAIQFLEKHHSRIWYTCGFGEGNKCDYLTNNMSESINAKIRGLKELLPHELVDSIRDLIMEKMTTRREVAKNLGDEILMSVMKQLNDLTSLLKVVKVARSDDGFAEVTLVDADNMTRRHTVDLDNRKCSCRVWQVSGRVAPMTHRSQWPIVDLGFKVHALRQKSGARSPRVQRIRGCLEPGRKKFIVLQNQPAQTTCNFDVEPHVEPQLTVAEACRFFHPDNLAHRPGIVVVAVACATASDAAFKILGFREWMASSSSQTTMAYNPATRGHFGPYENTAAGCSCSAAPLPPQAPVAVWPAAAPFDARADSPPRAPLLTRSCKLPPHASTCCLPVHLAGAAVPPTPSLLASCAAARGRPNGC